MILYFLFDIRDENNEEEIQFNKSSLGENSKVCDRKITGYFFSLWTFWGNLTIYKKDTKHLHIELLFTDIHPMFVLHTKDGILYELLDEDEKMRVYYKHVPNAFVFYERGIKQA